MSKVGRLNAHGHAAELERTTADPLERENTGLKLKAEAAGRLMQIRAR